MCEVIAPGLVWRQPGDPIKTDPRDARRLAAQYQGGMLRAIHVLSPEQEALRDLVRWKQGTGEDRAILHYPQTSGGLVVSIRRSDAAKYLSRVGGSVLTGEVIERGEVAIEVE